MGVLICFGTYLSEKRRGSGRCTLVVLVLAPLPRLALARKAPAGLPLLILRDPSTLVPVILYGCMCMNKRNAHGMTAGDEYECSHMDEWIWMLR